MQHIGSCRWYAPFFAVLVLVSMALMKIATTDTYMHFFIFVGHELPTVEENT